MGSARITPSVAVGRLLRKKRKEQRLTLRAVSERLEARGERIPTSTLVRIEQGKLDPGVRRLHFLLDLYRIPPHLVADLLELERFAVDQPVEGDLETLYQKGIEFWKRGDIPQALAHLFAIREFVPSDDASRLMRQKATISFAIAARNLGKYRLARQIVDDLLCEPPDASLMVNTLVLASSLWRGLGSMEMALALVHQAATHLHAEDRQNQAWVFHQQAKLLLECGRPKEAGRALNRALSRYRDLGDTWGETRAMVLRIGVLEDLGETESAIRCARKLITLSESHDHSRGLAYGHLELGRLMLATGSVQAGLESLNRGLGQAVTLQDRNAEFRAHYLLWKAHEALGDSPRARLELDAAGYFVHSIDDHSSEADEVRRILQARSAS